MTSASLGALADLCHGEGGVVGEGGGGWRSGRGRGWGKSGVVRVPDSRINRRGATQAGNKQGEPGDEGDPLQHVAVPVEDELSERQAGCWAAGLLGGSWLPHIHAGRMGKSGSQQAEQE